MIPSQLGRMILDNQRSTADEMTSTQEDSAFDRIDELIDEVAALLEGDRRRGGRPSPNRRRPVNRPSG
jgi:hypothetical protein